MRRPGAEFGGHGEIFRGPRFLNDVILGKNFHFHGQNFWWPFFSHRPGLSDFPFLFPDFSYLCCVKCRIITTLSSQEKPLFLDDTFFTLFVLSRASDNTTYQNIAGTDAWAVPTSNFFGGGLRLRNSFASFKKAVSKHISEKRPCRLLPFSAGQSKLSYKPIPHLGFRYRFWPNYKVTSTWIGRIDMSCAHAQWVANGHCRFIKYSCMTLSIGFDLTQCACAHDMSNRVICRGFLGLLLPLPLHAIRKLTRSEVRPQKTSRSILHVFWN